MTGTPRRGGRWSSRTSQGRARAPKTASAIDRTRADAVSVRQLAGRRARQRGPRRRRRPWRSAVNFMVLPSPSVSQSTTKLLRPPSPSVRSALPTAKARMSRIVAEQRPELDRAKRERGSGAAMHAPWRSRGARARGPSSPRSRLAAATRYGSGRQRSSRSPPPTRATPRPASVKTPWMPCARPLALRGRGLGTAPGTARSSVK